jgi:hypothetical protein
MIERPGHQNLIALIDDDIIPAQRSPTGEIINSISFKASFEHGLAWPPGCQHGRQRTIDRGPGDDSAAYVVVGAIIDLNHIDFHM